MTKCCHLGTGKDPVKTIIPSAEGFMDLAALGAKMGFGSAVGAIGAGFGARAMANIPGIQALPVVSPRSVASLGTTVGLYALWRFLPSRLDRTKDITKFVCQKCGWWWKITS